MAGMGADLFLHAGFGNHAGSGIPYNLIGKKTPRMQVRFVPASSATMRWPKG